MTALRLVHSGDVVSLRHMPRDPWSLSNAATLALAVHYKGQRKEAHAKGWCREIVETFPDKTLWTLSTDDLITYDRMLLADGLDDETRKARMSVVSTLYNVAKANGYPGPKPYIPYPNVKRKLKWWLNPTLEQEVLAWLQSTGRTLMHDFVRWQRLTGLRVEETLAVSSLHLIGLHTPSPELTVPGTKTEGSQSTLPISLEAAALAVSRLSTSTGTLPPTLLFEATYKDLWRDWQAVRLRFGLLGIPTATLKALRRSFARELTAKGAPLALVQQMMRHRSSTTTMGYLRLTGGGFSTEEMRVWLNGTHQDGDRT